MIEELGLTVQASAIASGAVVTAFVAHVEVIAPDGTRHVVRIDSVGLPAERADRILADATE